MRGKPLSNPGPYGVQPVFHLLRSRGISLVTLGAHTGASVGFVSAVLNGHLAPQRKFIVATAQFAGVAVDQLFTAELLNEVEA